MTRNKITFLVLFFLFLIIIGVVIYLLLGKKGKDELSTQAPFSSDVVQFSDNPQKGDAGYKEQNQTITVGTEGTYKGKFEKVADGKIYFSDQGFTSEIPLNKDEVAIQCTTQSLAGVEEIDLSKVVKVKVLSPNELGSSISKGEPIAVFVSTVGTGVQVHTIVMNASKCPS